LLFMHIELWKAAKDFTTESREINREERKEHEDFLKVFLAIFAC